MQTSEALCIEMSAAVIPNVKTFKHSVSLYESAFNVQNIKAHKYTLHSFQG